MFDFLNGLFSLIFVVISIFVGGTIASKYFKQQSRTFLLVGITWILMTAPWYPSTITFITSLFTPTLIGMYPIMVIGNIILPFVLITWITAFTDLIPRYKGKQKIVVLITTICIGIYLVLFFIFLGLEPSLIGEELGKADVQNGIYVTAFQLISLLVVIITGTIFSKESLVRDNREVRTKGKFLLIAFWSLAIGAILDVFSNFHISLLIVARIILITSAFEFYCGFILPPGVKKLLDIED